MPFDTTQSAYLDFRETLKQHTNQVIAWTGSGLSQPVIPSWVGLRDKLLLSCEKHFETLDLEGRKKQKPYADLASNEENLWRSFTHLKKALGITNYTAEIRRHIEPSLSIAPPQIYNDLWDIGISGCITLNIDRYAAQSYSRLTKGSGNIREFDGINANKNTGVLRGTQKFVANLHGRLEDTDSWVFTEEEFRSLTNQPGYKSLINGCIASRTILFIGISADDPGATMHLEQLRRDGLSFENHYWVTHRNDLKTDEWAQQMGIRRIHYNIKENDHSELAQMVEDLKAYIPREILAPAVIPDIKKRKRHEVLKTPDEVELLKPNEIRAILNAEAIRILGSSNPNKDDEYEIFWNNYDEAIYRAWSVKVDISKGKFFNYTLKREIAKGAFGTVYEAEDDKQNSVAIKILHGNIRDEKEMMQAFRRGVSAMRILSNRNVDGMVPYRSAWEIPAAAVMELIDGPNLVEALDSCYIQSWEDIISVSSKIAGTVRMAHQLPERVLHRDLRPHNIMIKDYYTDNDITNIVLLDFDLSWHRDASGLSVVVNHTSHGYAAPEQVDPIRRNLSRSALVDSFGFGMTMFYLATAEHPIFSQHLHKSWAPELRAKISKKRCKSWQSLPRRFARLITNTTKEVQNERWDMTMIVSELEELKKCLSNEISILSNEHIAEEFVCRTNSVKDIYTWDEDTQSAQIELNSGFRVCLVPSLRDHSIRCSFVWMHTGNSLYKDVSKFIDRAKDKVASTLKKGGWRGVNVEINTGTFHCHANTPSGRIQSYDEFMNLQTSLSNTIDILRFD